MFNEALEYVNRKTDKGNLGTTGGQIIAHSNNIVLVTKSEIIEKKLKEIVE